MTLIAWVTRRTKPYLIVGWLFYLGTLVPVIGLVQVGRQAMADRYTYIPIIGVLVALIWSVDDLASRYELSERVRFAGLVVVFAVLAVLTRRQVALWHDDITLWSYNISVTTNNVIAEDNLGIALLKEGRAEEALPHFYKASQISPADPISAANVGTDLLAHGKTREAIAKYEIALRQAQYIPMLLPNIYSNLGSAFLQEGDLAKAREQYKLALELNPDDTVSQNGLRRIESQNAHTNQ
jgi:protein O-mannosyl-transferase